MEQFYEKVNIKGLIKRQNIMYTWLVATACS